MNSNGRVTASYKFTSGFPSIKHQYISKILTNIRENTNILANSVSMDNYDGILFGPSDVAMLLAQRMKAIRKRKKITQHQLASRSNVSYASLRRFEQTGLISLESFIKLAMELGVIGEVRELFTQPVYTSIEEVLNDRG